ncbi:MAG: cob(I)yrinic acid a,c-diamide adenosyltransferase [Pirellulaceae bacterium]
MAIHIHRIYTKFGDQGQTQLVGGVEVSKASIQVESYGEMDELISHLGVVRATAKATYHTTDPELVCETDEVLRKIQNLLYEAGAELASPGPPELDENAPAAAEDPRVRFLEKKIDRYRESLAAIDGFTLPGDSMLNAHAHVARAVCRRWERILVRRKAEIGLSPWILIFANRLSDYLFAYTRWASHRLRDEEVLWRGPDKPASK